ncbi:MAG: hypothetical protein HOO96_09460 [Polyangiaceae bacterium]|nr:hypothetical protein [Polyangiaceae bacterium]
MPPKPRRGAGKRPAAGKKPAPPAGITPTLLFEQVKNTAPWALALEPVLPAVKVLRGAAELEPRWRKGEAAEEYLVFLLAAHFTTVATFVPTDVDQRIRQHVWTNLAGARLASAIERTLEVAAWDVRPVTERHVDLDDEVLAGHQGEWFSVLSGALGRALSLGDAASADRARAWIEAELTREARLVQYARKHGTPQELLSVVTTVAHNLGDLSRVVDTWSPAIAASDVGRRYARLGHEDGARFDGAFVYAGALNKQLMALENHRFLPLRGPRALRRERAFLLPFGPYFYDWGKTLGATPLLADEERAEILQALLGVHERRTEENGCLRAIAGMNAGYPGGVDKLGKLLSAEGRMAMQRGGVRQALRRSEPEFLRRFHAAVER